jgi:FAD/FMN-containing dehydrogenase
MSTGTGPRILDPEQRRIADLASGLRGRVLMPQQDGFDAEHAGFNQCVEHRPALIVAAEGPQDVVAAIRFAADGGLPVAVHATGHGVAAAADGALLINTSRMDGLQVHADIRTARIEAGVRWRQVIDAAARFRLAPLNGSAPDVGAVSYTLGGGMGLMARKYGFAADHVRSLDVVTPDGKLRHASHKENADLFWALRGGKGNFGVVVSMQIELMPVSRLYGGALIFDGAKAADVLRTWQVWTEVIPEEMTSSIALMRCPDLPDIPEPLRGRYVAWVRIAYLGSDDQGERLVEPLRGLGPRLLDTVTDMPYTDVGSIHSDPEFAAPWVERTAMLHRLDGVAVDTLLDSAGPDSGSGMMVVELRHLGGALRRQPRVPNAVGNRDAAYSLLAVTPAGPEDAPRAAAEMERMIDALEPWRTGGKCLNFLNGPTVAGQAESAYDPGTYRRLRALKAKYDPGNMFRFNVNIPPRVGG